MNRHIDNTILASLATGLLDEKERGRVLGHLEECGECRGRYRLYEALLREVPVPSEVNPPDRVRQRIFSSFREIRDKEEARGRGLFKGLFTPLRGASVLAAVSAIALIIALRFFTGTESGTWLPARLAFSGITGTVTVDGRAAGEDGHLEKGASLHTGSGSFLDLTYRKILVVRVAGDTSLAMESSRYNRDTDASVLEFRIDRGTVISTSEYRSGELTLAYITPFGKISPVGTEFLVRSDASSTTVMIAKGAVRVESTSTGETMTGRAGEKIVVAGSVTSSSMDDRDMEFYRSVKGEMKPGGPTTAPRGTGRHDGGRTVAPGDKKPVSRETSGGKPGDGMNGERRGSNRDQKGEMRREMREGMQDKRDMRDMREMRQSGRGKGQ